MPYGLTLATVVSFLTVAFTAALTAVLRFRESSEFAAWRDAIGDPDASRALTSAENASQAAEILTLVAGAAAFALTISWLYRAVAVGERFGGTGTRWSRGWAVGGWFIPVANAVIPKLVLHEVERVSSPAAGDPPVGERWRSLKIRLDGWIWWICLLLGSLILMFSTAGVESGYPTSATFDEAGYRRSLQLLGIGFFVLATSAAMGAVTVRRLANQLSRAIDAAPEGRTEPRTTNLRPYVPDSTESVPNH